MTVAIRQSLLFVVDRSTCVTHARFKVQKTLGILQIELDSVARQALVQLMQPQRAAMA